MRPGRPVKPAEDIRCEGGPLDGGVFGIGEVAAKMGFTTYCADEEWTDESVVWGYYDTGMRDADGRRIFSPGSGRRPNPPAAPESQET